MLPSPVLVPNYCIGNNFGPDHRGLAILSPPQADRQSKPRSMLHDDAPSSHANHQYNDHNIMITDPIDHNQPPSEGPPYNIPNDTSPSCSPESLPESLPLVIGHMSLYARRADTKFLPKLPEGNAPTALEHRFVTKNILNHDEVDISLIDVQQGEDIFRRGIECMPDTTVQSAVVAKRADAESKCLRALAMAWELEAAEKHALLLQSILRDYARQYLESRTEATFFERLLVKRTRQRLEDDADFTIAAYAYDLMAFNIAGVQLNHLETISADRELPLEDSDTRDVEYCFSACMDSILREPKTECISRA